jgi:hypothetical protein
MTKRRVFFLLFFLFPLLLYSSQLETPETKILSSSPDEVIIEISLPSIQEYLFPETLFSHEPFKFIERENYPPLPYLSGTVAISETGGFSGEIERIEEYSYPLENIREIPTSPYPSQQLLLEEPQVLRDYRIVRFQFHPITYIPQENRVRITESVVIRISKTSSHGSHEKTTRRKRISRAFYRIYEESILNFDFVKRPTSDIILYLIITPDAYYTSLLPFEQWKSKTGIQTKVVLFSDIGSNPSYSDIRDFLLNTYTNWEHPPDYFLAIGDAGIFPVKYTSDSSGFPGMYANDNYYVSLDYAGDVFPDIHHGRLPIQNSFQLETMINKIINYESNPYMTETSWYKEGVMVACDQFPTQIATKNRVLADLLQYGYQHVDSFYATHYWSTNQISDAITNAVNSGRSFVNYRGTGWDQGWYASFGYIYHVSHVQGLNNGRKLPIVTSIGCGVAKFDEYNCYGEQWMRNGTPTSEKGAVSFYGPTWNTHTRHNNRLDRGLYVGFLKEGLPTLGEAGTRAKLYMYDICGMSDTTATQMNEYLILGDPTILVKTDIPDSMSVSHLSTIPTGPTSFVVSVLDQNGPLKDAFVCVQMDSFFHILGYTNSSGIVSLQINPPIPDTIHVSVVEKNHIPYFGICMVNATGGFPIYKSHTVDDDSIGTSLGNDDGIVNPGESIELPLTLENSGTVEVLGVSAILTTSDSFITITDSIEHFGNIPPGDSVSSQDDFDFILSPTTPDTHTLAFELIIQDTNSVSYNSLFSIPVHSPVVRFTHFTITDTIQGNGDGIFDPGETVAILCHLNNSGSSDAYEVKAKLSTDDNPYIFLSESLSTYGTIPPGTEAGGTPYVAVADSSTPVGLLSSMHLDFTTSDGVRDSVDFSIEIGMGIHYLIWDPDKNTSSGPLLNTALKSCGYRGLYTTDIEGYFNILKDFQAVFICLGVYPNNHILEDGEIVDSLCKFLDNGGRMYMEGGDTWAYDAPTDLHSYFKIPELYDGYNNTNTILGFSSTFTNQMNFTYSGENNFMDQLTITGGSFVIFRNQSPYYINGVAYSGNPYKTVGVSFEFGGLVDGSSPSTKEALADSIMHFFGITGVEESPENNLFSSVFALSKTFPNPFSDHTSFSLSIPLTPGEDPLLKRQVTLSVFDVTGREVSTILDKKVSCGKYRLRWYGKGKNGQKVGAGIYFLRLSLEGENCSITRKVMVVR